MLNHEKNINHSLWNFIASLAIGFLVAYLPLKVIGIAEQVFWLNIYWVATAVMFLDFLLHIWARFLKKGTSKRNHSNLPLLIVDFIASVPFLFLSIIPGMQLLQMFKIFRVQRFLSVSMEGILKKKRILTISFFLFWLVLAIHWLSCMWLAIIGIEPSFDHYSNYVRSLYWVITTLTSVGYGDITPTTNMQMWYAMFVQLVGIGAFGYLIAHVVSIVSKKDPLETQYADNVDLLTATLKHRSLPNNLQRRILNYYGYIRREKIGYDESSFLESLPVSLRTEVAINIRKEFIHEIPLFKNAGNEFLYQIAMKLELIIITPGDYLFRRGDKGTEMYLIISGDVEILDVDETSVLALLSDGDYFGEIALFEGTTRNASVRALGFCNLYKLEKETFDEVVADNPDIALEIEKKARDRGMD